MKQRIHSWCDSLLVLKSLIPSLDDSSEVGLALQSFRPLKPQEIIRAFLLTKKRLVKVSVLLFLG